MSQRTSPRKLRRSQQRIARAAQRVRIDYTANWYILRFLRWARLTWLARQVFRGRTVIGYDVHPRTGRYLGVITVRAKDIKPHMPMPTERRDMKPRRYRNRSSLR